MDNKQNCISLTGMHLTDKSSISPYKWVNYNLSISL
jgi:hypothetical protein